MTVMTADNYAVPSPSPAAPVPTPSAEANGNPEASVAAAAAVGAATSLSQIIGYAVDPYSDTSHLTDAYVGVPQGYKALTGYQPAPVNTAPRFTGTEQSPTGQFQKPQYSYGDIANLYGAPPDQVTSWQMRLYNMGFLPEGFSIGLFDPATHDALENAMTVANANGYTMSEMQDILDQGSKSAKQLGWTSSGSGSGSTQSYDPYTNTSTSTQEQVNLTGRGGARALLVQALATEMGREPTKKETGRFLRSLNSAERENPGTSTTKSTTTTDPSPSGDSTTTTDSSTVSKQSKVDPAGKATKFARQVGGKEAQSFQASNFFSVVESLAGL